MSTLNTAGIGYDHNQLAQTAAQLGTNSMTRRTHCVNGHEFTPENTRIDRAPDGSFRQRRCRACQRVGQATRYAAQRAEVAR